MYCITQDVKTPVYYILKLYQETGLRPNICISVLRIDTVHVLAEVISRRFIDPLVSNVWIKLFRPALQGSHTAMKIWVKWKGDSDSHVYCLNPQGIESRTSGGPDINTVFYNWISYNVIWWHKLKINMMWQLCERFSLILQSWKTFVPRSHKIWSFVFPPWTAASFGDITDTMVHVCMWIIQVAVTWCYSSPPTLSNVSLVM